MYSFPLYVLLFTIEGLNINWDIVLFSSPVADVIFVRATNSIKFKVKFKWANQRAGFHSYCKKSFIRLSRDRQCRVKKGETTQRPRPGLEQPTFRSDIQSANCYTTAPPHILVTWQNWIFCVQMPLTLSWLRWVGNYFTTSIERKFRQKSVLSGRINYFHWHTRLGCKQKC